MLNITQIGAGTVAQSGDAYRLTVPAASKQSYHDAQITSYRTRQDFNNAPPVTLNLRAHAEGDIHGTAGFGFWNHPFVPGERGLRLPKAVWFFFGSPPNNIALAKGIPGAGWKCATFDATRWPFFALLPTAPLALLPMRIPTFYNAVWPIGQRAIGVSEQLLPVDLLHQPHDYTLEWHQSGVRFAVDGETVHEAAVSPRGKLGFIAWIDNQYAIVTPQGKFGWGLLDVPAPQTLVIEHLRISS